MSVLHQTHYSQLIITYQSHMSHSKLPKLRRTILAKVLRNLVANKSKAETTISETQQNKQILMQQLRANHLLQ